MPTFKITFPDGSVGNVTVPEGQTAAQALAFAKRSAAVGKAQRLAKAGGLPKAPPQKGLLRRTADAARGALETFGDNLTGGWGDEIAGAGVVAANAINAAAGIDNFQPGRAMDVGQQQFADRHKEFSAKHPVLNVGAAGLGLTGGILLPAAKAAKGASGIARAKALAKTGAAYGALSGAGHGDGLDRIPNAIYGAGAGAVLSPVIGGALNVATKYGGALAKRAISAVSNTYASKVANNAALRKVDEALGAGATKLKDAASTIRHNAENLHVPTSLSDLTEQARAMTGWAGRGVGPGQSAVKDAIKKRQLDMANRVGSHIEDTLGSTADPYAQSAAIGKAAADRAGPLYDKARQTPIVMTPGIREFMQSSVGQDAVKAGTRHVENIPQAVRNSGSEVATRGGNILVPTRGAEGGFALPPKVPALEVFDVGKQQIDRRIQEAGSRTIAQAPGTSANVTPERLQLKQVLGELEAQVPEYGQARKIFGDHARDNEALQTGLGSLPGSTRKTVPDATSQMSDMNDSQLAQFRLGDRTRLSEAVHGSTGNGGRFADATAPLDRNDTRFDLIRTIHGDDAANSLSDRIAAEREAHLTFKKVQSGSQTADHLAVDDGMAGDAINRSAGHFAAGNYPRAAWSLIGEVMQGRFSSYGNELKSKLGAMLTEQNPQSVEETLGLVAELMKKDAKFSKQLQDAEAHMSKIAPMALIGQSGDEDGAYGPPGE